MKKRRFLVCLLCAFIATAIVGCNYPVVSAPTPFEFPTPDLTLTAIFAPLASPTVAPPLVATATPVTIVPTSGPDVATATPRLATATPMPSATRGAPTNTSLPGATNTPARTNTPVIPTARPGASVSAIYLEEAPSIDGDLSRWSLPDYDLNKVVFGSDEWDGEDDLSGTFMLGWDEDNLYVAAWIIDEDYDQNAEDEEIYKGDSLEILLDTNLQGDYYYNQLSPDDFQLGLSPGSPDPGDDPEAYLWYPSSSSGSRSQVDIDAVRTDDGYEVEASIPWSVFSVRPQTGMRFGFAFSISDNDRNGAIEQQSMVSNVSTRNLVNPMSWGTLVLERR